MLNNNDLTSSLTVRAKESEDLKSTVKVAKEYKTPKRPDSIVSDTLIIFMRAIFDENYQKDNWHLNPKTEMYIRETYPEDVAKIGIKPAIVKGKRGGVRRGVETLGAENFLPMDSKRINTMHGTDDIFSGSLSLKAISTNKSEVQDLAFLCMLSINKFVDELIGVNGIAHIHSTGYSQAQPQDISAEVELWGVEVSVDYVIKLPFATADLEGEILTGIDSTIN